MNCKKFIKKNIKLFDKERYFPYFSQLLEEASLNIYNKNYSLLTNKLEDKHSLYLKKYRNLSLWNILTIFILFIKERKNEYNIDLICYKYLFKLCKIKIKELLYISFKLKENLSYCVKLYLELCKEKIKINKKKKALKKILLMKANKKNKNIYFNKIPLIQGSDESDSEEERMISDKEKYKQNSSIMKYLKKKHILYCNSMTRLFIGETDEESIKQRYLSNIIVKNGQRLNLNGSYIDLSAGYLKQLYHKIKKQKNENISKDTKDKQQTNNNSKSQIALKKPLKSDFLRILEIEEKFRKKKEKPKYFFPSIMNLVKIGKKQKKYNKTSSTQSSIKKTLESKTNENKQIIDTEKKIKQKNNIKKIKKKLKIKI